MSLRADAKSELISLVHDLRNPVSTIHVSAEMLLSQRLSEQQVHRIARNLFGASVRMKELLDEVLTHYNGAERAPERSDLPELVASAVDKVSLVAEAQSVQIVQNIPEGVVVSINRQRIQRVFVNLLVNALDAMPGGGIIRISAISENHSVFVKVCDTGPGIDPKIRDRLFQPFATAGKPGGLGLGLSCSREAVLDHGGQMWAEPSSQGACFAFYLPCTGKEAARSEPAPPGESPARRVSHNVPAELPGPALAFAAER